MFGIQFSDTCIQFVVWTFLVGGLGYTKQNIFYGCHMILNDKVRARSDNGVGCQLLTMNSPLYTHIIKTCFHHLSYLSFKIFQLRKKEGICCWELS